MRTTERLSVNLVLYALVRFLIAFRLGGPLLIMLVVPVGELVAPTPDGEHHDTTTEAEALRREVIRDVNDAIVREPIIFRRHRGEWSLLEVEADGSFGEAHPGHDLPPPAPGELWTCTAFAFRYAAALTLMLFAFAVQFIVLALRRRHEEPVPVVASPVTARRRA